MAELTFQPLTRREALQRIFAALAAAPLLGVATWGQDAIPPGIGWDPDLLKKEIPWPRLLTPAEKRSITVLGDLIIPADAGGPAASAVGVPDFIDEWVSAPYAQSQRDLDQLRSGLAALDRHAAGVSNHGFADLAPDQRLRLLEAMATPPQDGGNSELHPLFNLLRRLVTGGYYTTPAGWAAIGYQGNRVLTSFPGPSPEVRRHLGLD